MAMAVTVCASSVVAAPQHRHVAEVASCSNSGSNEHGLQACGLVAGKRGSRGARVSCRAVRAMAPDEEKMTRRSPLDFPIEWDRPRPGRRADIFPQFSPMKTPLPPPLPADPPEEDEDEEEKKDEEEEESPEEPEKPDVSF